MKPRRIYLEATDDLEGGYWTNESRINSYIYDRGKKKEAYVFHDKHELIDIIQDMQHFDYPCHAVPPLKVKL